MAKCLSILSILLLCEVAVQLVYGQSYPPELFSGTVTFNNKRIYGQNLYGRGQDWTQFKFPNIRYANQRRLEAPSQNEDYSDWTNATIPSQCPQFPFNAAFMTEDCLFLDIYTPMLPNPDRVTVEPHFPTIIWVHGGAFEVGTKDAFDGKVLARETDSIVVVINYRLGAFGFLSTGSSASVGNYGLKDVKTAIRWVDTHIDKFGGSKGQLTVVGHSAGAALVSAALLDADIATRVHGVVAMSGSVLAPWAIKTRPMNITRSLVANMNNIPLCVSTSTDFFITGACLRSSLATPEVFLNASRQIKLLPAEYAWGLVIDGQDVPFDPYWALAGQKFKLKGGFLATFSKQDASNMLPYDMWKLISNNATFTDKFIRENLLSLGAKYGLDCPELFPNSTAFENRLWNHYKFNETKDRDVHRQKIIQIATDVMFRLPAIYEAYLYGSKDLTGLGAQVAQLSAFTDVPAYNLAEVGAPPSVLGAYHGLDVYYLFSNNSESNTKNVAIARRLQTLVGSVAFQGHAPGIDVTRNSPYTYMELENNNNYVWIQQNNTFNKEMELWTELRSYKCRMPEHKYEPANSGTRSTMSFAVFSLILVFFIGTR